MTSGQIKNPVKNTDELLDIEYFSILAECSNTKICSLSSVCVLFLYFHRDLNYFCTVVGLHQRTVDFLAVRKSIAKGMGKVGLKSLRKGKICSNLLFSTQTVQM